MRIICSDIQEEGCLFILFNKPDSLYGYAICNIFIFPQCLLATFHVTDTGNSVYDRLVMSMIWAWFQLCKQFRMIFTQRFARERFFITHFNRIVRVQIYYTLILNPYTRHTVTCRSHDIRIIESQIGWSRRDKAIPILSSRPVRQSQMPFAYSTCRIAALTKHICNCRLLRPNDHSGISRRNPRIIPPPGIMSGKQRIT